MKFFLFFVPFLFLSACVSRDGLSAESRKGPHSLSSSQSTIVIHEFADLQCPACRMAQLKIVTPLLEKHGGQIRYEFKHFPLRTLHRYALVAAEASECAADQGKFWDFVEKVYEKQPNSSQPAKLKEWSSWFQDTLPVDLHFDTDLFHRCVRSHIKKQAVLADYEEGKTVGVTGTPTFFVNGERVDSTLEALEEEIDSLMQGMRQKL